MNEAFYRRTKRYEKVHDAHPEKYCWAELVWRATIDDVYERLDSSCTGVDTCKKESNESTGRCWCGKFEHGEFRQEFVDLHCSLGMAADAAKEHITK